MKQLIIMCAFVLFAPAAAAAQGNGFSFQGRLNDGTSPANGSYDLQFKLYDAIAGGNQIGSMVDRPNTVLANGVFSVVLDFGATAFNNPASIFIEIAVRPNGSPNAYNILGPRQQLTVVPYAVRAMNATNADNATNAQNAVNATNAQTAVNATNAQNAVNATNAVHAQNSDNATNAANSTLAATASNALNLGNASASSYARLNVVNDGDLKTTGELLIDGNARQFSTSNGLVKSMIVVSTFGLVTRCYNGITNTSAGNCGFTITQPASGVTRIDFGFQISDRFVSVTPQYVDSGGTGVNNSGANYRAFSNTALEVFTFTSGNSADTQPRPFTILIF